MKKFRVIVNKDKRCKGNISRWSPEHLRPIKKQPWYVNYCGAQLRCNAVSNVKFHRYGGRGISFLLFPEEVDFMWHRDNAAEMKKPSIDRIDVDGDYEFINCRFIEFSENISRSRKGSKWIRVN